MTRVSDPNTIVGLLAVGVVLVLLALLIIAIARPIAKHLPSSVVAEYVPPPGDVLEHGLLVRADRRVLAAVIVDLAVRGKIRILAPRGAGGPVAMEARPEAPFTADERALLEAFRPRRLRPRQQRRYLRALEEIGVPVASIEHAPEVYFLRGRGAFRNHRRRALTRLFDDIRDRIRSEGLAHPGSGAAHLVLLSLLFLIVLVFGLFLILGAFITGEWVGALVVLVDVLAMFWVMTLAPPPLLHFTDQGRERRRHLSGLRDYIRLGEQDRIRMLESQQGALRTPAGALTPGGQALGLRPRPTAGDPVAQSALDRYELTEHLLPYAVLFRQERSWQREFEHLGGAANISQHMRVLGTTLEGVVAVLEVIVIIGQVLRVIGGLFSFLGRAAD